MILKTRISWLSFCWPFPEQNYNSVPFLHYIVCNFFVNSCCQVVQVFSPKFYFSFFFFVCLCVICEFVSRSGVSQSLSNSAELISAVSFGNCPCDNRYNEMPLLETAIFSWWWKFDNSFGTVFSNVNKIFWYFYNYTNPYPYFSCFNELSRLPDNIMHAYLFLKIIPSNIPLFGNR